MLCLMKAMAEDGYTIEEVDAITGPAMGVTAENVARKFNISRKDQDAFALKSHQKAWAQIQAGRF